jgi:hypothetical protein
VVAVTASAAVRLVSSEPVPSSTPVTALAWGGHVFTSKRTFAAFLEARGVSYEVWAARHPGAAPWMRDRSQPPTSARAAVQRTAAPQPAPSEGGADTRDAGPTEAASGAELTRPSQSAAESTAPSESAAESTMPGQSAADSAGRRPAPAAETTAVTPARPAERPAPASPARRSARADDAGTPGAHGSAARPAEDPPPSPGGGPSSPRGALAATEPTATSSAEAVLPSLVAGLIVTSLGLAMMTMVVLVVRFVRGTWNP